MKMNEDMRLLERKRQIDAERRAQAILRATQAEREQRSRNLNAILAVHAASTKAKEA